MGVRGPLRNPDSRRGRREGAQDQAEVVAFPVRRNSVEEIFQDLVDRLTSAGLPLKEKDAFSIQMAATNLYDLQYTDTLLEKDDLDAKVRVRLLSQRSTLVRDAMKHLGMIGATTISTLRLVKPGKGEPETPAENALDDIYRHSS